MEVFANLLASAGRSMTSFRRRNSSVRKFVPLAVGMQLNRLMSYVSQFRSLYVPIHERTENVNVYHCCVQKTGSQWIKSVLTDIKTYQYSGLGHFHYQSRMLGDSDKRKITDRSFERAFPLRTIASPLYITYDNYLKIPKRGTHKAFFVARDPRDLLVSWYFSTIHSHVLDRDKDKPMFQARQKLVTLSERDGLLFGVDYLNERGHFAALASWALGVQSDPDTMLFRYEELSSQASYTEFRRLYDFLDFRMPDDVLAQLVEAYSFKTMTGRAQGTENKKSHLRSGSSGKWKDRFDAEIEKRFFDVTGDLVERLGYK